MKKFNYLALFAVTAFFLSSCGGLNKMQENAGEVSYEVTPDPLEVHSDKVDVKVDVKYPEKYFNKNAILTLTPVLKYEGGETAFEAKKVQGENVEANNQVISKDGGSVSYNGTVDYTEDMLLSDFVIRVDAELKGNTMTFGDYKLADGIVATPKLVVVDPKPVMVGDKFERIIPDSYKADIHYIINRSNVRNSQVTKEDMEGLTQFLKEAEENERIDLKEMKLHGYASPDGPYDLNDRLAEDRLESAQRYYERESRRAELEESAKEGFLAMDYTPEDWEGFKEELEESDVPDKELILRVLSMYSDPEVREQEIKNLAATFEVLAEEVLPELRRSRFLVDVDKIGLSDDEIKSVWSDDPDSLNLEETLYAATLHDDLETKLAIYKHANEKHPNCFRAINNVGYVYVLMDEPAEAKEAFQEAKEMMDNDVVNNNLGVVALMEGDLETAEELFQASMGAGDAVNYNLGIIKIMQGEYDAAENYFGNTPSVNAALAKVLQDDYDAAMTTINNADTDIAKKYYVKAVIAAKQDKEELVYESLEMAFGRDADLKDRAAKDIVFAEYFENDTFKSLVE
jgi:tetratricopeptide (TPR) repeat protein